MFRPTVFASAVVAVAALLLTACDSGPEPAEMDDIVFDIDSSNSNPYAGEIVTFTVDAYNTLGKDTEVNWDITGGDIVKRSKDGAMIQVQFDDPGEYIVNADLIVEGDRIRHDDAKVKVSEIE